MFIDTVLAGYKSNIELIKSMISGVDQNTLFSQSNKYPPATLCHPIWTLGHLVGSAQGICEEMGVAHWLAPNWARVYGQYSDPVNNPAPYHTTTELLQTLDAAVQMVDTNFRSLSAEALQGPMPDKRYWHVFPTLKSIGNFPNRG